MSSFHSDYMCSQGIQDCFENFSDAVRELLSPRIQEILEGAETYQDSTARADFVRLCLEGIVTKNEETGELELDNFLEEPFEGAVQEFDDFLSNEGADRIIERFLESGDYAYIGDGEYVHRSEIEDTEEYQDLVREKEELEEELENCTKGVQPHGHLEPLAWNEGRQVFVCPKTGRVYKLVETDEPAPIVQ